MSYSWNKFDRNVLEQLDSESRESALSRGLCQRLVADHTNPDRLELLPHTLLPTHFPSKQYRLAERLQVLLNLVYHRVAYDHKFLCEALKDTLKVDPFTRNLFQVYEQVRNEGCAQSLSLGLLRADYMINEHPQSLRQIEVNTIASSLGGLTTMLAKQHRENLRKIGWTDQLLKQQLPDPKSTDVLSQGMLEAWKAYGKSNAVILFVVEEPTGNICDQKQLELRLVDLQPELRIVRRSFAQLREQMKLDEQSRMLLARPSIVQGQPADEDEVALVYLRCGYRPDQYEDADWLLRVKIEKSKAIKCPSIHYQLAGVKKVQQVLTNRDQLRRFCDDDKTCDDLMETFAEILPLGHNPIGNAAFDKALQESHRYVLKPQREGGGNNFFDEEIIKQLNPLKDSAERDAYILMERIRPVPQPQLVVRANQPLADPEPIISELGIFGAVLGDANKVLFNQEGGFALRSKPPTFNEGGVAAGFGLLDTPLLI